MFSEESLPNSTNLKPVTQEDKSCAKTVTGTLIKTNRNIVKVLGSSWNTVSLEFNFLDLVNEAKSLPPTKRSLLKTSAKIFDPLDLLSPFTIQWKVLFQLLCHENVEWDDKLSNEHLEKWNLLISDLQSLNNVCVPRCYFEINGKVISVQLHCICDASEKTYAAATYLRSKYESGLVDVNLIAAKTRVAPLKKQSTPRLELLGENILARLASSIQKTLELFQDVELFYWVDSKTVLYWIKNAKPWKQYVLARVKEIRECTTQGSWRHCPGVQNPDDHPSLGMSAKELVNDKRWWEGP